MAKILPDVLYRIEFRRPRRQEDRRYVPGYDELRGRVPSRAIEQQHSMRALCDVARDFLDVELHHPGVDARQRQRRSRAPSRANRAKEIGVFVALIRGLTGPRSSPSPLPDEAVLLADARFVLEPDFDRRLWR